MRVDYVVVVYGWSHAGGTGTYTGRDVARWQWRTFGEGKRFLKAKATCARKIYAVQSGLRGSFNGDKAIGRLFHESMHVVMATAFQLHYWGSGLVPKKYF